MTDKNSESDNDVIYRKVSLGVGWKRPICWLFGHEWRHPVGYKVCTRCDEYTSTEPSETFVVTEPETNEETLRYIYQDDLEE